jgi:subtilisin family serine protease
LKSLLLFDEISAKHMAKPIATTLLVLLCECLLMAQTKSVDKLDQEYLNWFNKDRNDEQIMGININKAYQELLNNKKPKKTVIVAVIDSGVDIDHEDLKGKIWVNEDEIPNNGLDDDNNGYIDDINGWNFIGNSQGVSVTYENYEFTRLYRAGPAHPHYAKAKEAHDAAVSKQTKLKENIERFESNYNSARAFLKEQTSVDVHSSSDLHKILSRDERVLRAKEYLASKYNQGLTEETLASMKTQNQLSFEYFLNVKFNPRELVGDDVLDINDHHYGNPDVKGPRSNHGTSVTGVIAANRNNGVGIDGIVADVKIMCIRSTPHGDERDKDVALAIRYAVDNGADIINMSFGKDFSPQKQMVDEAVRLAAQKGVLLVHGSGNDGDNIDITERYPSDKYLDGSEPSNWLSVGATGPTLKNIVPIFSNYGQQHVDIFAPGEKIISLDSSSTYSMNDGTSLAAPMVTGVAALVLSYYPDLTPEQLIQILLESSYKLNEKVSIPDLKSEKRKRVKFNTLSKSGGIIDAHAALKLAENTHTN